MRSGKNVYEQNQYFSIYMHTRRVINTCICVCIREIDNFGQTKHFRSNNNNNLALIFVISKKKFNKHFSRANHLIICVNNNL